MKKHPILIGTLLLSSASLISRVIGFLYRIYLSRTFGAQAVGILQMTAPVTAMVTAVSCAGIQTALSKRISELTSGDRRGQRNYLLCALFWSVGLSCFLSALVWRFCGVLSDVYLQEPKTEALLKIMAFSFPLSAAHGCFSGYYFGQRKTSVPAFSQLIEQLTRVGCVIALCSLALSRGQEVSLSFAVLGSAVGELAAVCVCVASFRLSASGSFSYRPGLSPSFSSCTRQLFSMAIPLSFNRLALNFLQSLEAVRIPLSLQLYGCSSAQALTIYGILTGMALPVLFFPGAFLGAFNHMLLPTISEAQSQKAYGRIRTLTVNTGFIVVFAGLFCSLFLFLFSDFLGTVIFAEPLAGSYIRSLCLLCPILYFNQVLSGILQGLGRAFSVFFVNTTSVFLRLGFVFFAIPRIGIRGYFHGILASQLLTVSCFLFLIISLQNDLQKGNKYNKIETGEIKTS